MNFLRKAGKSNNKRKILKMEEKTKNKKRYYINNDEFIALLDEYKATENRKTYEKIGKCFLEIARGAIRDPSFFGYSEDRKDEMISNACYYMIKYINKFDKEKSNNPFGYFSQIAFNAYLQYINETKKREKHIVPVSFSENLLNDGVVEVDD